MHIHKPAIIHRDLKSLNLLLSNAVKGESDPIVVKVTDFGLSRTILNDLGSTIEDKFTSMDHESNEMMTGQAGTFHWMAPEIMLNQPYGLPADVYSYAICMWEIMAREPPFNGVPLPTILHSVAYTQARPSLEKVRRGTDPSLVNLMTKCWDHNPNNRPDFA
jgi:serine/threonine protein kinase